MLVFCGSIARLTILDLPSGVAGSPKPSALQVFPASVLLNVPPYIVLEFFGSIARIPNCCSVGSTANPAYKCNPLQLSPLAVLLNMPTLVDKYTIRGSCGSIVIETAIHQCDGRPEFDAFQVSPPSMDLKTSL